MQQYNKVNKINKPIQHFLGNNKYIYLKGSPLLNQQLCYGHEGLSVGGWWTSHYHRIHPHLRKHVMMMNVVK